MIRPGLAVNGKEMRAYLNEPDAATSLNNALADGAVKIVSTADKRTRTGTAEHGEYYATEHKVILNGGDVRFVDSVKGQTRGKQLTWFSNSDRLLVNGAENRPADSILQEIEPVRTLQTTELTSPIAAARSSTTSPCA